MLPYSYLQASSFSNITSYPGTSVANCEASASSNFRTVVLVSGDTNTPLGPSIHYVETTSLHCNTYGLYLSVHTLSLLTGYLTPFLCRLHMYMPPPPAFSIQLHPHRRRRRRRCRRPCQSSCHRRRRFCCISQSVGGGRKEERKGEGGILQLGKYFPAVGIRPHPRCCRRRRRRPFAHLPY